MTVVDEGSCSSCLSSQAKVWTTVKSEPESKSPGVRVFARSRSLPFKSESESEADFESGVGVFLLSHRVGVGG